MKLYEIGKIAWIGNSYIILENNRVGYIVFVPNTKQFIKSETKKVYIYEYKNEHTESTYGFSAFGERILFEDLLGVPGIGPKTALILLKNNYQNIIDFIANGDIDAIAEFQYIGIKTARQLVFELQTKYLNKAKYKENHGNIAKNVKATLKTLGFHKTQIDYALANINLSDKPEIVVENAIKTISSARV